MGEVLWTLYIGRLIGVAAIAILGGTHTFEYLSQKRGEPASERRSCNLYKALGFALLGCAWVIQ